MSDNPIWEVALYVDGPVKVRRTIRTTQQKGFQVDNPFYSDIEIQSVPSGLKTLVTARAPNETLAYKAAVFFFGHMLDALTLTVNRPMHLSFTERQRTRFERHDVRRIVEQDDFEHAFREAQHLATGSPSFLRSLGWYRKGLTTDDPLDKFLAFWIAIEVVASKYFRYVPSINQERARSGSISQVWECFKALWGPCERWPVINGQTHWIDEGNAIRVDVAHGRMLVNIDGVAKVAERLQSIEEVSYNFLRGWRDRFLDLDRHPPSESLSEPSQDIVPE